MGVSLYTALVIQANGAEVGVYGPNSENKYCFELFSIIREHYRGHATSDFFASSAEEARNTGQKYLEAILAMDLDEKRRKISESLGPYAEAVQQVADASKFRE